MFLLVFVRHVGAHPDELQHGVSIQSSINLGKTFPRISRIRIILLTQILARVFAYLPPFISQILDFIYWTVLIFILIYFEWRETENQQYPSKRDSTLIRAFLFYKIYIQKSLYTETWANRTSRPSGSFLETWVPYHSICNTTLACKFIKD